MSDQQEAQEKAAQEAADGPRQMAADTVYVVFVQNGVAHAVNDLGRVEIKVEGETVQVESMRRASPDDLYRYSQEISKDVQIGQTVEATMQAQMQMARQLQQQQAGGLHVPGR